MTQGLRAWDVKTDYENREFYKMPGKSKIQILQKVFAEHFRT